MWEKPSYEIIDVCAEVTAYIYKDSGDERRGPIVDKTELPMSRSSMKRAAAQPGGAHTVHDEHRIAIE